MRSVHVFETLQGNKISNVKGDACNPWRFSPSIDRVMIGGCPKEARLMEGLYPNPREVSTDRACWRPLLSLLKIAVEYRRMDEDPHVSGFGRWNFNIHDDDQMWGQALAIDRMIELLFQGRDLTVDEEILMNLLQMAVIDWKDFNKPMDVATRAMRHSVALASCLWVMFEAQKPRVYLQGIWREPNRLTIFPGGSLRA